MSNHDDHDSGVERVDKDHTGGSRAESNVDGSGTRSPDRVSARRRLWLVRFKALRRLGLLFGRCAIPLSLVGVATLMLRTDQAQELIRIWLERQWDFYFFGDWVWVALLAFAWAILVALCSKAAVHWPYPTKGRVASRSVGYRIVPILIGYAALISVFSAAMTAADVAGANGELSAILGQRVVFGVLLLSIVYFFAESSEFVARLGRRVFPGLSHDPDVRAHSRSPRVAIFIAVIGGLILIGFGLFPIQISLSIGSLASFFLCMALWLIFLTALSIVWRRSILGQIITLGQVAVWGVIFAFIIALVVSHFEPSPEEFAQRVGRLPLGDIDEELRRATAYNFITRWLEARIKSGAIDSGEKRYPVFLVAASGGGIRAAYWAAQSLSNLQQRYPSFTDHVLAMSGVSGGALGLATFSAILKESHRDRPSAPCLRRSELGFSECSREILQHDFLAPAVVKLLTTDVLAAFVPGMEPQRGDVLRSAWETVAKRALGIDPFAATFDSLWLNDPEYRQPGLFLSSTHVKSGARVITGNVVIIGPPFIQAWDRQFATVRPVSLGDAVLDSARFPYVSPTGHLKSPILGIWGHVVDGGYIDNSGALVIDELLEALMLVSKTMHVQDRIVPLALYIDNNVDRVGMYEAENIGGRDTFPPETGFVELTAPLSTLDTVRQFNTGITLRKLQSDLRSEKGKLYGITLVRRGVPIPLGWTLSVDAMQAMDEALKNDVLNGTFGVSSALKEQ